MRRTAALARWLDDPAAQGCAQARAIDVARAVHALPALAAFRAALRGGPGLAVSAAAADALVADDGWATAAVAAMLRALAADPFFVPPFPVADTGLHQAIVLHDCPRATIGLGATALDVLAAHKAAPATMRAIVFTGRHQRLRFVRAGGARIAFFARDGDRAVNAGTRRLADGAMVAIDGAETAWTIAHATGDLTVVQVLLKDGAAPHAIEHDAATGRRIAASATDEGASRVQMLVSLLGAMGRAEARPAIAAVARDPDPQARWHAMRTLVAMDADASAPLLADMAVADPDAQVRVAARATLDMLAPCPA